MMGGVPERPKGRDWKSRVRAKTRTEGSNPSPSAIFLLVFLLFSLSHSYTLHIRALLTLGTSHRESIVVFKDSFRKNKERLWGRSIVFKLGDKVSFSWDQFTPKRVFLLAPYLISLEREGSFEVLGRGKDAVLSGNFTIDGKNFLFQGVVEGNFGKTPFRGSFLLKGDIKRGNSTLELHYKGYMNLNMGIECFPKKVSISYKKVEGWLKW